MTDLRQRVRDAYDDIDCPHSDHYPIDRDGNYVTVPCGACVADAVLAVVPKVAPAVGQRERVDLLAARLVETEVARLEAVADGHRDRHNELANMNRDAVAEAAVNDLRSLVIRWALDRGKAAHETKTPRNAADLPPGSVLGWGHNVLLKDTDGTWSWAGVDKTSTDDEVQPAMAGANVLRIGYPTA